MTGTSARELLSGVLAGILRRPARCVPATLGVVLGIGGFVATLGLVSTVAAAQLTQRFSVLEATRVTVRVEGTGHAPPGRVGFPPGGGERVEKLNGVVAAGVYWPVPTGGRTVRGRPGGMSEAAAALEVYAVSPGALRAMRPELVAGTLYDEFHQRRGEPVAVLAKAAARRLGITRPGEQPAVFIGARPYTVVGIVADPERTGWTLPGVMIPTSTALEHYGPPARGSPATMLIRTEPGAARLIARQAPVVLRPEAPGSLDVAAPPVPEEPAAGGGRPFLLLAGLALTIGMFGIADTTLVAVGECVGGIGPRRTAGARQRYIAARSIAESTLLGALGGLVGSSLGVLTVVTVALVRDWPVVINPFTVVLAPAAGGLAGLLAGLYPALRWVAVEPGDVLHR